MANLVTFAKKLWKDKVGGNTPITAAELNRIESGVNDCANQINKLGDSVSLIHVFSDNSGKTNLVIAFSSGRMNAVVFTDNNGTGNLTYVSRDSSKTIAGEDSLVPRRKCIQSDVEAIEVCKWRCHWAEYRVGSLRIAFRIPQRRNIARFNNFKRIS